MSLTSLKCRPDPSDLVGSRTELALQPACLAVAYAPTMDASVVYFRVET